MNPTAIYSKSGKGVQEASGKTSVLKRADRSVLSAIDGRATLAGVAEKVGKQFDAAFEQLISQLDRDGFIREVSAGTPVAAAARPGAAKPAGKPGGAAGGGEELDFTISIPVSPSKPAVPATPPPVDPKVKARQESERKAQEDNMTRARREAEERAQREKDRVKLEAEARIRAETEARLRHESESKGRADIEAKLRAEAEAKVKAAREAAVRLAAETKAKAEAELQAKLEAERKAREEAERARKEAEEKARREAEELRLRLEEERKAREEIERKAREEAERARREAEEKARREAEELRQRLEEERKAREEAERKAREEERRRREEEERRAREEKERQARAEAERKAREAEEARRAKEAEERRAREAEERRAKEAEDARRAKEAEERRAREAEEREAREAEERRAREAEAREAREAEERQAKEAQARREAEARARREEEEAEEARARESAAARKGGAVQADGSADSLLADLDSFAQGGDEDERKEKDAAERKSREAERAREAEKARDEAGRKAKEDGKRKRRAEEERREREAKEREEAARREKQEQREREEAEAQKRQEAEAHKRRERESARSAQGAEDDIGVSEDDLDMSDVRQDQKKVAKESRKAARAREREQRAQAREARERAREREREEQRSAAAPASYSRPRRPRKWGKPVTLALFVLLVAALGVIHLLPISTTEYENAATLALGRPVKLGTGHISLITGLQLKFDNVVAGDAKIASVRAYPEFGSLFGERKAFSRIELEGVSLPQAELGDVLYGAAKADNFSVSRVVASKVMLSGPLKLPELEADLAFGPQGRFSSGRIGGPDGLHSKIAPKGDDIAFDTVASSFSVPFAPDLNLSTFAMKGSANRRGMNIESWGGGTLDGAISGTATVRWGSDWRIDGVVTVRGINAAVFAPALLSDGRAEGTAKFSVHGADPLDFKQHGRIEGRFSVNKGVLGSFDLSRAIQTGGRQAGGSTPFTDMSGEALYERGAIALRNVSFGAGKLNAGASADIAASGALSGRIVADVHASSQTLRAIVNIGGTAKEPQVKN